MANVKKLIATNISAGRTVYCIVRRESDGNLLNNADGTFAVAPANKNLVLVENASIPGLYEASESRVAWNDGRYRVFIYALGSVSITPVVAGISVVGIAPTRTP